MNADPKPPLRIALLGADPSTPALVRALVQDRRFEWVGTCEMEETIDVETTRRLALAGRVRPLASWEALLDTAFVDAVIVARSADQEMRSEQLRKLVQVGVAVLAAQPVVDSMLLYYELDMIRRETHSVLLPDLSERHHPAIERLKLWVSEGESSPIGKAEQLLIQRHLPQPNKESVVAQFARDADFVRAVAGDMTRLGAMAGSHDAAAYGSLGIQMSGPSGVAVRWSVAPVSTSEGAQIVLVGAAGKAIVEAYEHEPWTLARAVPGASAGEVERFENWDAAASSLDRLARALAGETVVPDWVDAARGIELAETIDRSLHKGRTIELYYEDHTEEQTFKGLMASVGCGLLILGLLLVGVVAIAEQIGIQNTKIWPYLLAGVLGVFLLLQLLTLVFRKPDAGASLRATDAIKPAEAPRELAER